MERRGAEHLAAISFCGPSVKKVQQGLAFLLRRGVDKVLEVKRVSERIIVLRVMVGETVLNLVSVYAPQVGRAIDEKGHFSYPCLGEVLSAIDVKSS